MKLRYDAPNKTIDELLEEVTALFPDKKVKKLNKSTIVIPNGKVQAILRLKKGVVSVGADLNTRDNTIMALTFVGILAGVIGVFVIFAILYPIYMKQIKAFKQEAYDIVLK